MYIHINDVNIKLCTSLTPQTTNGNDVHEHTFDAQSETVRLYSVGRIYQAVDVFQTQPDLDIHLNSLGLNPSARNLGRQTRIIVPLVEGSNWRINYHKSYNIHKYVDVVNLVDFRRFVMQIAI